MPKEKTWEEALAGAVRMSEKYTARGPYKFYPEPDVVAEVQRGLAENDLKYGRRYCP